MGHTADYTNLLYLDSPANSLGLIFNNQATPVGTTFDLGTFTAGTELVFRIDVTNTGNSFFTGPASRNPDLIEHAIVDDQFALNTTYVGFEDLFGGGDRDFDDINFSFTNTTSNVVPAPATLLLFGSGLGALLLKRLRRKDAV